MRIALFTTTLAGAALAAGSALAEGATSMAFAVDRGPGESLGAAGTTLFACAGAAFLVIVALLVASHGLLGRCAESLDGAERALPEEEGR